MSLPPTYQRTKDQFEAALVFLKNYQWLYNSPNTHMFKVFREFPADWSLYFKNLTTESLNHISKGVVSDGNIPPSLQQFFDNIQKLKINWTTTRRVCEHKFSNNSGLSQKKTHEILSLAPLINETCKAHACDYVIDVGAGLGYLSELLHQNYQYPVLGIEGSPARVKQANANRNKYSTNTEDSVRFVEHFITDDSAGFIRNLANRGNACIAGLHACADLSVTILNLFVELDFAKALVIMPCCYHRLELQSAEDIDGQYFKRFPASGVLKDLYQSLEAYYFLQIPFLRLACQNSVDEFSQMTEDQHRNHAKRCLFRVILQEVAETENCKVTRLKRKSGRLHHDAKASQSNDDEGFEDYLANLTQTHALIGGGEIHDPNFLHKMRDKWTEYKEKLYLVVAVQALQAALQGVCEDVVMLDRVELLREKGMDCTIERVTDRRLSPRCYAVVATKQ